MEKAARMLCAAAAAGGLGLAVASGSAAPQSAPTGPPVAEKDRVTAIDLVFEASRSGRTAQMLAPPAELAAAELRVTRGGRPAPVVGVAPPGAAQAEAWSFVLYFDRPLASAYTVRWAAEALAEQSAALVELGEVEVVLADPEPRRVLAPTRDAALLDQALSGLYLSTGGSGVPVALREELLIAPGGPEGAEVPARRARRLLRREVEVVRRQADRLLARLLDRDEATPRRAVLLVSDGFDLRPAEFYGERVQGGAGAGDVAEVDLGAEIEALADTLAAYGWVVGALAPPPPAEGVVRFPVAELRRPPPPFLFLVSLRRLAVWLDKNRDPKKADAYAELGRSLRAQGKLEDAAEAMRKAIYHYYDHPKTATRQAAALVELGEILELAGDERRSRAALRAATAYDASLVARYPFAEAELAAPHEPLDELAVATAGARIVDAAGLDLLLDSLARRFRLTYQLAGTPDGSLAELELGLERPNIAVRHPRSGRWGTPTPVAELRLRALLAGSLDRGGLELVADRPGPGLLAVRMPLPEAEDLGEPRPARISWATGGRRAETRIGHRVVTGDAAATPAWLEARLEVPVPPGARWLAVLAEDLATGSWGGAVLEVGRDLG